MTNEHITIVKRLFSLAKYKDYSHNMKCEVVRSLFPEYRELANNEFIF